tara:strand:- start:384 stop:584 length:201 start_codon:yes stop_codon:yes gene_type:complete
VIIDKKLIKKINDVKQAFSSFADSLPESDLESVVITDWDDVIDELENVNAEINSLEQIAKELSKEG